jgi:AcrR family transcriptional regulator
MAVSSPIAPRLRSRRKPAPAEPDSNFDRRLAKILRHAVDVFYEKGYEGASMRDLSRASRMSLAGMYYYFDSKEKLLYLIQKHTFTTIMEQLRVRLAGLTEPEPRLRALIANHLEYFLDNPRAMKVLSHEDDVLKNGLGDEVRALKRDYVRLSTELVEAVKKQKGLEFNSRVAVLSLFGMMNWIYTWYNPRTDADAGDLARQMGDILLGGIGASSQKNGRGGARTRDT